MREEWEGISKQEVSHCAEVYAVLPCTNKTTCILLCDPLGLLCAHGAFTIVTTKFLEIPKAAPNYNDQTHSVIRKFQLCCRWLLCNSLCKDSQVSVLFSMGYEEMMAPGALPKRYCNKLYYMQRPKRNLSTPYTSSWTSFYI